MVFIKCKLLANRRTAMEYHKKDFTKDSLTLEETHILASNLNRIETAKEIQKNIQKSMLCLAC